MTLRQPSHHGSAGLERDVVPRSGENEPDPSMTTVADRAEPSTQ
jgi:hypothetical protein